MKYLEELKKLNLPKDKFAVFGSGVLAIHGIRENKDIDLIVKKDLWRDLTKKYPLYKEEDPGFVPRIRIGNIEIFDNWPPFKELDTLIDSADIINGIRFVKLEFVLKWKKNFNREKDQNDVKLIEEFLSKR